MSKTKTQEVQESQLATTAEQDLSIFVSGDKEGFNDDRASLPRVQAVRGEVPSQWGYFIAGDQLALADWVNFDGKKTPIVEQVFQEGTETGILIQHPRFLVCPKSPILALDRKQSKLEKKTIFLGRYNKEEHGKSQDYTCCQYFWVFLLDENNQLLHNIPFSLRAKGANLGSFSTKWQEFTTRLNSCFYTAMKGAGASPKPKNNKFNCLSVFVPELKREMVGTETKSFALRVVGFQEPTMETWMNYFVGGNPKIRSHVWDAFDPENLAIELEQPRLIQEVESPALPPQQYQALPSAVPVKSAVQQYDADGDEYELDDVTF